MKSKNREKVLIGITMGDPCGIGPEVILKALSSQEIRATADFVIIGCEKIFRDVSDNLGIKEEIQLLRLDDTSLNTVIESANGINLLDLDNVSVQDTRFHKPLASNGRASVEYIMKGLDLAMGGKIDAVVTAPISKEAIKLAGFEFAGHTELLKEKTGAENTVMLMVGNELRVSFVTTHLAIKDVFSFINQESVFSTIKTTETGLRQFFGIEMPKIAVCGLNPHCGDGNRFGTEESDIIIPAIKHAQEIGIDCVGPISSDVVFNKAIDGEFDVVVAQYHDQGTIPIKMHAFDSGVNITLGIPIIRTSPMHGTAYNIAGKGIANPGSMIEAIRMAIMMIKLQITLRCIR
ncbi:MAG: pyridoxal phosphate biosynthetic protein pdxA [Candidatus Scalindua rubra]|uniref:Pyridoxal phosphate biosynthetic protein pdxA n=1 Tax=Candidatus Scalindua rubra TaxID=1872076 RepID=A0A1E3XBV2_9BACT|nr:MAG: pyridoxal phosphate biosynthetic protein pdxA [Candidatus Scalindua rubra]